MKNLFKIRLATITVLLFFAIACDDKEVEPNVITTEKFNTTIAENPTDGFLLGTFNASATRGALVYSLTDVNPDGAIAIDADNGDITVANAALFDFEINPTITATGNVTVEGQTYTDDITINVTDVNEIAITANDFTASIDEGTSLSTVGGTVFGTSIGTVDASLTSGTGTIVYSIVSQSVSEAVNINANGQITVANPSAFDYEAQTQITGTYRAAIGSIGENANFTITINDLDEHVVTAQDFTVSVDENSANGTSLGAPTVTLTGGTGSYAYSILNQSVAGAVDFNNNGAFEIADANAFDYETNTQITGTYQVEVSGSTSPDASATATFTIDINDKFRWDKTVFAGEAGTASDTDGTAANARFRNPRGMAFDPSGNLYIADDGNHRIRKIDTNGNVTTYAGSTAGYANGNGTSAQFRNPFDVDIDNTGRLWVTDPGNFRLRYIDALGEVYSATANQLSFIPRGVATNGTKVYVTRDHYVMELETNNFSWTTVAGSASPGSSDGSLNQTRFNRPIGIDAISTGLYIADYNNRKIRRIFGSTSSFPGAYFQVTDVEVAPDGNIYAVETGNKRVRIVTTTTQGAADEIIMTGFASPEGIAIHPTTGDLYISDAGNHAIYKLEKVEE